MPDPARLATRLVVAATIGFALLSARQVLVLAPQRIVYAGLTALSAPWSPTPADDTTPWRVSEGIVPAPPANATRQQLVAWLGSHYPVLTLEMNDNPAASSSRIIDLGGGPPRALFVEPGLGLVGREP